MKHINTSSIVASFFIANRSLGLSERNNGSSIISGSLMIENLTRRPNCVLMLPKRGRGGGHGGNYMIFDQISKPCFCFSRELQKSAFVRVAWMGRPFSTNEAIHWNHFWPKKVIVSLSRDPCRRNEPLLPSSFLLQNRSTEYLHHITWKPWCGHV